MMKKSKGMRRIEKNGNEEERESERERESEYRKKMDKERVISYMYENKITNVNDLPREMQDIIIRSDSSDKSDKKRRKDKDVRVKKKRMRKAAQNNGTSIHDEKIRTEEQHLTRKRRAICNNGDEGLTQGYDDTSPSERVVRYMIHQMIRPAMSFQTPLWIDVSTSTEHKQLLEAQLGCRIDFKKVMKYCGRGHVLIQDDPSPSAAIGTHTDTNRLRDRKSNVTTDLMKWLICPLPLKKFLSDIYENRAVVINRKREDYCKGWLSIAEIKNLIFRERSDKQFFLNEENLDIVKVDSKGNKIVKSCETTMGPTSIWDSFSCHGFSLRLLHPQRYCDKITRLLSGMEQFWKTASGCNAYLTPANSQGFKPHFDDIDAFVIQLEGSKRWRLYHPQEKQDVLARVSSHDFDGPKPNGTSDIGEPVLDIVLEEGDFLYMPRGMIHQAIATHESSLHLTISVNQRMTYMDFLSSLVIPNAIQEMASNENFSWLKRTLPRQFQDSLGVMNNCDGRGGKQELLSDSFRTAFTEVIGSIFENMNDFVALDAAADQVGKQFLFSRLRPVGVAAGSVDPPRRLSVTQLTGALTEADSIRVNAPDAARIIVEDDEEDVEDDILELHTDDPYSEGVVQVVHCFQNDIKSHASFESDACSSGVLRFPILYAPALEIILKSSPSIGIVISSLPLNTTEQKVTLANILLKAGIVSKLLSENETNLIDSGKGKLNRAALRKAKKQRKQGSSTYLH